MGRKRTNTRSRHRRKSMGKFRSLFEKDFAQDCNQRGISFSYESEKIKWTPPQKTYNPDFIFEKHDGSLMIVETKGRFTAADRTKMKAVVEQHPELDIRMVFQNANNKLTKASGSKTYKEWCKYHGIKWSEKTIPASWRKEIKQQIKAA